MEYRLVPFEPKISDANPTGSATDALEAIIQKNLKDGWEFKSIENHSTIVPGSTGCFGLGATDPYPKTISIAVFTK